MNDKRLVKAYIIDDNQTAIDLLCRLLQDYSVDIVGTQTDTAKAREELAELEPDLLFLDVEMPQTSGLDFWTQIRPTVRPDMKVVFYTAYDKYVLEALRRQAFDYMLKPPSKTELAKIMTRYYEQRLSNRQQASGRSHGELPIMLVVNAINEHTALRFDQIAFFRFQSERKLWEVVTTDGTSCLLRHKTTADVILNYSKDFVQIHKRYIVNLQKISKIQESTCVLVPPLEHIDELHISKNYRHELMGTFYNM